jgi:hypothetical protein
MTLPSPVAGALVVVEREAASTANVAVTGNIRGAGSTTITLSLAAESEMFLGTASTWNPVAGHKTLGSLATQFAGIFSPLAYGAKGDGTTDDTAALQNCAAASITAKGIMDLGSLTYKTTSPIAIATNFHLRGSGYGGGTITNSASGLFTMTGGVFSVIIENCTLNALGSGTGGGHVFDASAGPSMSQWRLLGVSATQTSTSHCIWFQFGGAWIDCLVDQGCNFTCSASATISPWTVNNTPGNWNSVKFSRLRCTALGATVPFFNIDPGHGGHTDTNVGMTASSTTVTDPAAVSGDLGLIIFSANFAGGEALITAVTPGTGYVTGTAATATLSGQTAIIGTAGWVEDIIFEHITWEVCTGGAIWMTASNDVLISMCAHWDATATSDIYHFAQAASGYPCRNIVVRGGRCGAVTGGASNFFADSNCTNVLIDSFGEWGTAPVISSPAGQTTIINPTVAGSTVPPPASLPALAVGPLALTPFSSATTTGTVTLSPAKGSYQRIALTGNVTLAAPTSNQVDGQDLVVELTQPASGGPFTATWNAAFIFQGGATAPALSTAASAVDVLAFRWNATASKWIEQYRRLGYAPSAGAGNDPLNLGMDSTILPSTGSAAVTMGGTSAAYYMRLVSGGYAMSSATVFVTVSSGNMSVAAYTRSGSGASAQPTGGQLSTSGAVATPALGFAAVALGASVTPNIADFLAISGDTSGTSYLGPATPIASSGTFLNGFAWQQTSGHPLPSTPSGLSAVTARSIILRGQ